MLENKTLKDLASPKARAMLLWLIGTLVVVGLTLGILISQKVIKFKPYTSKDMYAFKPEHSLNGVWVYYLTEGDTYYPGKSGTLTFSDLGTGKIEGHVYTMMIPNAEQKDVFYNVSYNFKGDKYIDQDGILRIRFKTTDNPEAVTTTLAKLVPSPSTNTMYIEGYSEYIFRNSKNVRAEPGFNLTFVAARLEDLQPTPQSEGAGKAQADRKPANVTEANDKSDIS